MERFVLWESLLMVLSNFKTMSYNVDKKTQVRYLNLVNVWIAVVLDKLYMMVCVLVSAPKEPLNNIRKKKDMRNV